MYSPRLLGKVNKKTSVKCVNRAGHTEGAHSMLAMAGEENGGPGMEWTCPGVTSLLASCLENIMHLSLASFQGRD